MLTLLRHNRKFPQLRRQLTRFASATPSLLSQPLPLLKKQELNPYGQPTPDTHPHLLKAGELVPGFTVAEFQERRRRLITTLQMYATSTSTQAEPASAWKPHLLIAPAARTKYMSGDIPYTFRQDSSLFYLTGCLEPVVVLVITIDSNSAINTSLFLRPRDAYAEMWEGPRTGPQAAVELFGVDEAYNIAEFEKVVSSKAMMLKPTIWYDSSNSDRRDVQQRVNNIANEANVGIRTPATYIQSMRLKKSAAEQQVMRRSCQIASVAINETIAESRVGMTEHQLGALFDFKCRMYDANHLAYPPVVASGANATVIHYISNTQMTQPDDLVLLDGGCQYGGYSSDLTRTWPISGQFTPPQRSLYELVLLLQKELIDMLMRPGAETLQELNDTMYLKLGKYLRELGILPKYLTFDKEVSRAAAKFCPHNVGHFLGLDVHDTDYMSRNVRLQPGMVFTVEPAVYIAPGCTEVPPQFRGIGIRIEDDILINAKGTVEVLSDTCAKRPNEMEVLMKSDKIV